MENNTEILTKINSGEPGLIAEAVQAVKEDGDLDIAGALLDHIGKLEDGHTLTIVTDLLADIKDNRFRDLLVRKLQASTDARVRSELLRIVWESALDYSDHLEEFLHLLQEEDFTVAFEASTVVENMVHHLTTEQREQVSEAIRHFPEEKQYLVEPIREELEQAE